MLSAFQFFPLPVHLPNPLAPGAKWYAAEVGGGARARVTQGVAGISDEGLMTLPTPPPSTQAGSC